MNYFNVALRISGDISAYERQCSHLKDCLTHNQVEVKHCWTYTVGGVMYYYMRTTLSRDDLESLIQMAINTLQLHLISLDALYPKNSFDLSWRVGKSSIKDLFDENH